MRLYADFVLDSAGAPIVGATVAVYSAATNALATIYASDGTTPLTNPLTTDSSGAFSFYAPAGQYNVLVSMAGFSAFTRNGIIITDALLSTALSAVPTTLPTVAGVVWNNGGTLCVS